MLLCIKSDIFKEIIFNLVNKFYSMEARYLLSLLVLLIGIPASSAELSGEVTPNSTSIDFEDETIQNLNFNDIGSEFYINISKTSINNSDIDVYEAYKIETSRNISCCTEFRFAVDDSWANRDYNFDKGVFSGNNYLYQRFGPEIKEEDQKIIYTTTADFSKDLIVIAGGDSLNDDLSLAEDGNRCDLFLEPTSHSKVDDCDAPFIKNEFIEDIGDKLRDVLWFFGIFVFMPILYMIIKIIIKNFKRKLAVYKIIKITNKIIAIAKHDNAILTNKLLKKLMKANDAAYKGNYDEAFSAIEAIKIEKYE